MSEVVSSKVPIVVAPYRAGRQISRRALLTGAAAGIAALATPAIGRAAVARILVVGAGAGGAVAARALKQQTGSKAQITAIVGKSGKYHPPFLGTSLLLGNSKRSPADVAGILMREGINAVRAQAVALDRTKKLLQVEGNGEKRAFRYDLLVAVPGVAFGSYGDKPPAGRGLGTLCWTDTPDCASQATQLRSLKPGATIIFVAPPQPYRCPPSIYERACLTANLLKPTNPKAKVLIVDEKDEYPMQELFEAAYADHYDEMVEWIPRDFHGGVEAIDAASGAVKTEAETFRGDFLHALPPQEAPAILRGAGLVNERGYCDVVAPSMRSVSDEDVYIVGDAADIIEMSKSAVSAAVQGRLAARDIAHRLTGRGGELDIPIKDLCWTHLAPDDAIALGGTYEARDGKFVATSRHVSAPDDDAALRKKNAAAAMAWPGAMLEEMFGHAV